MAQSIKESEEAKAKGNAAFGKHDYKTATRWYTVAINKNKGNHILYSRTMRDASNSVR
jgi:hypothetical protein